MKKNIYKQKNAMNIIFIHTYIATSIHHIYSYHIHIYIIYMKKCNEQKKYTYEKKYYEHVHIYTHTNTYTQTNAKKYIYTCIYV